MTRTPTLVLPHRGGRKALRGALPNKQNELAPPPVPNGPLRRTRSTWRLPAPPLLPCAPNPPPATDSAPSIFGRGWQSDRASSTLRPPVTRGRAPDRTSSGRETDRGGTRGNAARRPTGLPAQ